MKIQSAKAGIGTGRAGLQAASGLFSSAGLFDKGVKSFNPLDLNPYLLFDAQTSMIGTLENPTLDLDPSKQDTLDVITATRAGVATFTDANGLIASASPNTVRVDYVDGVPMILVEPSSVNLVTYSEDFSQWTSSNSTVNSGQITSPDGTLNGSSLQINSGGLLYVTLSSSHSIGASATFSCFVKSLSQKLTWGGATANGTDVYSYEDLGNGWYRQSLTRTFSATGSIQPMFTEAQAGSDLFYIWGAQLETGSVATSYIPTAGSAVTRAKDDLVISGSDFTDFYNQSEGTFYVESITNRADGQPFILSADNSADSSENNTIVVYYSDTTTTTGFIKTSGSIQAILAIGSRPSAGALSRTSLSYKTNDIEGSVDGGSVASDTSATIPTTINRLSIGTRLTLEDDYKITGHVKRLIFWPYHSDSL